MIYRKLPKTASLPVTGSRFPPVSVAEAHALRLGATTDGSGAALLGQNITATLREMRLIPTKVEGSLRLPDERVFHFI